METIYTGLPSNFSIDTWNWLKDKMDVAIQADTQKLKADLDEKTTAKLRGRIQAFEHFIKGMDVILKPK